MLLFPPIFAFGFLNLSMLGWLAAASAPILIHLWARRHYRQTAWAAIEFLLAAVKRHTRRMFFEQWLLLLIRMAIIILLVLAVAEPYWQRPGLAASGGGTAHRILVVDGSLSMDFKPTDHSRFEKAKELARQIVEDSRQGDVFTLLLMSSPPRVVVGKPALEHVEILREIETLKPAQTTADLPGALAAIEQLIPKAQRENPRITQHEIYFLTDLQRVTWSPKFGQTALAEFRRRSAALADAAQIVILDVGQPDAENLAVTAFSPGDPVIIAGRDVNLSASIKNFGRQTRTRQLVELLVDGRRIEQKFVDVPAGQEIVLNFNYRFETPGDHALEIRAAGDALDEDNHRFLALNVRQEIRVLCIDGRPRGQTFRGAADYLVEALAPQGDDSRQIAIKPEVTAESALVERELAPYDCVFICNVAQFTPHEVRLLHNYLQSGGSVVFFLGDQVLPERYNTALAGETTTSKEGRAGEGRILPARLGTLIDQPQLRLDPLGFRHPILEAFRGRGETALLTTPVFKYFKLQVPKNSTARVVLATASGDPLVVEEKIERGHVILSATTADTSWTAMPLWPSFLPLVQEILAFCLGSSAKGHNLEVGDPIAAPAPTASADVPVTVQTPDGRTQQARRRTQDGTSLLEFADTTQSGVYAARFGPPMDRNLLFAVNVDTAESDLAQLSPDELQTDVWPGVAFLHQTAWQNAGRTAIGASLAGAGSQVELLYLVLGLLFLETFLAWRFGYHAT
ncbi:MAG: VWA domain-containing protein [Thermoguttaceae bacterium]|jgi:hypothetical protein